MIKVSFINVWENSGFSSYIKKNPSIFFNQMYHSGYYNHWIKNKSSPN